MKDRPITTIDKDGIDAPLTDVVYQRMLDSIYAGALAPGSVINEVELAREFGVSRGPVREAVRRLQGIQIVTREPYTKARVVSMTAASALELFQMRMGLEGVACFLATQRMSDADIEQLQRDLEAHQRARQDGAERHFDLHERIVRASGNKRIITALCDDLYHLLRIYRRHSGSVLERKDDAFEEHWQIVRAISRRDARLAESLMRSHIERAADHVAAQLGALP
ncbi:GntR family transcriptional regulator [Bordetella pseudohinzii]|uniref:GntR family transcriptional regulator n=1 Tax=Bordetella pseudohinzii TaxID=1331258 RepID=A0A0J6C3W4_9BORD|nr:GntR family transcriptional regulator [Bordetella pseudohinzii]ANY17514.1 GntR family transcriptional regulator [Bordetella pseudohinzii]KMM25743.1 GntR family transcriptional regulator [Bordetella pseudohinzii]KXA81731.1 GntR family transcriptional regulator [Bordetella pseudohinzii]KXA83029.1 GntR family transcriptional regulator [Bordetella pseudohinzii]CUI72886.1 Pyruvate dehydrogenase complex repressor [Bordetella pseudohinzii]